MNYFQVVQEFRRTPKWSNLDRHQQSKIEESAAEAV